MNGAKELLTGSWQEGNYTAFDKFVELYEKEIYAAAYYISGDQEIALQVSQEVFVQAYGVVKTNQDKSIIINLYKITVGICRERAKESGQYKAKGLTNLESKTKGFISPRNKILIEGLQSLTFDQRAIMVLRDIQGLTYEEISEVLNYSLEIVTSHLTKARVTLKQRIASRENKLHERSYLCQRSS